MSARVRNISDGLDPRLLAAEKMVARGYPDQFVSLLGEALGAMKQLYNQETKEWDEFADWHSRLAALKLGMPYVFGLPEQRQTLHSVMTTLNLTADDLGKLSDEKVRELMGHIEVRLAKAGKQGSMQAGGEAKAITQNDISTQLSHNDTPKTGGENGVQ